ncbi:uncharacterized protein LOC119984125 isoform X3 [Tripterygium wilfordii]|uniref:uncharacterized protein LOC119984125 isoform X3 n=1 Tax=Tripterygium wilfordii TaxID=458696 RepID=UPI0018F814BB|nr:uncharacterized protein LOC119984125 isoform X3 [Tripterygium wilfordii]
MKELDACSSPGHNDEVSHMILKSQDSSALPSSPQLELDNGDDDDLDPAMKEELDREVEDFAQRLNSHWPERMQELLLGQERRLGPYRGMSVVLCIHIHAYVVACWTNPTGHLCVLFSV